MVADTWGNNTNGAICRQAAWNGGNNQQWRLTAVGNSRYQIINRGTGAALDSAGNTTAGSDVVMWAPNGNTNNHWTITTA
ncbi:RICIN domain-containing protein [Actinosynnema sp. NPDC023794]